MGLSAVMDAGGDGTEYVDAKRIHWFYSLSPADRDRVREGSDLEEGESDYSDSDSEDEERGIVRKAAARVVSDEEEGVKRTVRKAAARVVSDDDEESVSVVRKVSARIVE